MMTKIKYLFIALAGWPLGLYAQSSPPPAGGGEATFDHPLPCLSEAAHEDIRQQNIRNMEALHLMNAVEERGPQLVSLDWPLRQAAGYNDPSYYIISNFVDQNTSSGSLLDYNCGSRTYDGHYGTDIVAWPFMWYKQSIGQVEIIAAEAGTIVGKQDGYYDLNCSCTGTWNAVYVRHSDGSVAWYGHMKNGSLTGKSVGQTVSKGEYLGLVGSSGCSTAPHLHFELYANSAQTILQDPFGGACNALNGSTSWWGTQHPYIDTRLLKIMTHDCTNLSQPDGCPSNSYTMCAQNTFAPGATVSFSSHYRQQQSGATANHFIRKPDNSVWQTWNSTPSITYTYGSWWYWYYTLPSNAALGTWTYEVTYSGQTVTHPFTVSNTVPVELTGFSAREDGKANMLRWTTASEGSTSHYVVEKSINGSEFFAIGEQPAQHHSQNTYQWADDSPAEKTYYRIVTKDVDGRSTYSNTAFVQRLNVFSIEAFFRSDQLVIRHPAPRQDEIVTIYDITGRPLFQGQPDLNSDGQMEIQLPESVKGVLLVNIQGAQSDHTLKLVRLQ